jgi:hypothetical protein
MRYLSLYFTGGADRTTEYPEILQRARSTAEGGTLTLPSLNMSSLRSEIMYIKDPSRKKHREKMHLTI